MKTFILCGGFGTRLDHEGKLKAKPMVKIGKKPILIHIVENFVSQGFNDFVFCLGHKSETIINYFLKEKKNTCKVIKNTKKHVKFRYETNSLKFNGDLIYTGIKSGTGGRILEAYKLLNMKNDFIMTYGDGLSNINIKKLINFHYKNKSQVTLTAVRPKQRYGILKIQKKKVRFFDNSKKKSDVYINGGFFVISKNGIKKIKNKSTYWEKEPLSYFLKKKKLFAFKFDGFWKSLDTLKDKNDFNEMIKKNKLPWKNIKS